MPNAAEPLTGATFIQPLLPLFSNASDLEAWFFDNCVTGNVSTLQALTMFAPFALTMTPVEALAQQQLQVCRDNGNQTEATLACAPFVCWLTFLIDINQPFVC